MEDYKYHAYLGSQLLMEGREDEALEQLRLAVKIRPDWHEAWFNIGMTLSRSSDTAGTVAAFEEFLKYCPRTKDNLAFRRFAEEFIDEHSPEGAKRDRTTTESDALSEESEQPETVAFIAESEGKDIFLHTTNDAGVPIDELMQTARQFVDLPTWIDAYLFLEQHSELFSSVADLLFSLEAKSQPADSGRLMFQTNLNLLRRCRQVGVEPAFAEAMQISTEDFLVLLYGVKEIQPKLMLLFEADWAAKRQVIEQHPELVNSPATQKLLAYTKGLQRREDARELFEQHIWLLERCRTVGIDQAFSDAQSPQSSSEIKDLLDTGVELIARAQEENSEALINEALVAWQDILNRPDLKSFPEGQSLAHAHLGLAFLRRYEITRNREDLDRSLEEMNFAVEELQPGSISKARWQANLTAAYMRSFEQRGELSDLNMAIQMGEESLTVLPEGVADSGIVLNNLGGALLRRFEAAGDPEDLNKSIKTFQNATDVTERGSPSWCGRQVSLGGALIERFNLTGQINDVDAALKALQQSLPFLKPGSASWNGCQNNLGRALRARYKAFGQTADIDAAIESYRSSLGTVPEGSLDWAMFQNNLGNALRDRFSASGELADINAAVLAQKNAVFNHTFQYFDLPTWQESLANSLLLRYEHTRNDADLNDALDLYEQALGALPQGEASWAACRANMGGAYFSRFKSLSNLQDLHSAIVGYEEALSVLDPSLNSVDVLGCAKMLAMLYSGISFWNEAAAALLKGLAALEVLYENQLLASSREAWLSQGEYLHRLTAYALALAGRLPEAVLIIEQGRARGLSNALALTEADLSKLIATNHADLSEQYRQAVEQLNHLLQLERTQKAQLTSDFLNESIRTARADLERVISDIRRVPGFEDFLSAPDFDELRSIAKQSPLIYLTTTEYGGVALIVRENLPVTAHQLPELTDDALRETVDNYNDAYYASTSEPANRVAYNDWLAMLEQTTRWLWDAVVGDLVEECSDDSEVILIPTSLLGLLPLHAAWHEDAASLTGRRYAIDALNWHYAPNGRAYRSAQQLAAQTKTDSLLAVSNPQPVSAAELPGTVLEVQTAARAFTHHLHLTGTAATRADILAAIANYRVLHFACHGYANPDDPLESGLILANDEVLTLSDLLSLKLWRVRLAILSACETGVIGTDLPDEVVSLSSGLLQIGAAAVIAPLWGVDDRSTLMLLSRFYELWRERDLSPSIAFRMAQQWLRDTTNQEKKEHYKSLLPEFDGGHESVLTPQAAAVLYQHLDRLPADERAFALPFHWGAFCYWGV